MSVNGLRPLKSSGNWERAEQALAGFLLEAREDIEAESDVEEPEAVEEESAENAYQWNGRPETESDAEELFCKDLSASIIAPTVYDRPNVAAEVAYYYDRLRACKTQHSLSIRYYRLDREPIWLEIARSDMADFKHQKMLLHDVLASHPFLEV